jgi:hypothetical protein
MRWMSRLGATRDDNFALKLNPRVSRVTEGADQALSPYLARGVAQGALNQAQPRLSSSSGLKQHCSASKTKQDLAERKIIVTNLGRLLETPVVSL